MSKPYKARKIKNLKFSIVIITSKRAQKLVACLNSILNQKPCDEIVVVVNGEDSKTMVIAVDGMVSTEQTTHCKIKCVVTNESTMDDCVDGRNDKEVNESEEGIDTPSPVLAKRRPRKLRNPKGYSFETESGLLSPEDDVHVELKKIQNSGSFKRDGSSVLASESEADGMSPDGQQHDEVTPSPPPRVIAAQSKNLRYSLSFNTAGKLDT